LTVFEVEEWEHDACLRLRDGHDLTCTLAELSLSTVQQHINAEIVSTFVNSTLSGDVLARMPRLKLIATRSTGYDHVDLTYCRAHGITVCNVPSYGDVTVAEHVFAPFASDQPPSRPSGRDAVNSAKRSCAGSI